MSYNDPTHWRGCAENMRGLAETMKDRMAKRIMHRIAEDYDRLAETAEQRANSFPRNLKVVPAGLRLFAYRRKPANTPATEFSDLEIPSFLRRGPAMGEEVPPLALPPPRPRTTMTTMDEIEKPAPPLPPVPLTLDDVAACISRIEKAMGLPPSDSPPGGIRDVGCKAIAQALEDNSPP
jgi:hypothetical protein